LAILAYNVLRGLASGWARSAFGLLAISTASALSWQHPEWGRPLVDRWGRYLLLRPHEIDRAHDWFERHGDAAVFFSRLLPVVRTFISLPAGVARMSFWKFSLYTLLGCLPWTFALTFIGYKLGERWDEVEAVLRPFSWLVAAAIVLAVAWWVWRRVRDLRAVAAPVADPEEPADSRRG
jgi:membrane protein DedA with SNARE-associated domain